MCPTQSLSLKFPLLPLSRLFLPILTIHSVSRIVALITMCGNTSGRANTGKRIFTQPKQVFKDCAVIFFEFLQVKD